MALPTVDDLRDHLRLESAVEDAQLGRYLTQARAAVEAYLRQPIEARPVTMLVSPPEYYGWRTTALTLPYAPIAGPVTVEDAAGGAVSGAAYTLVAARGMLHATTGLYFGGGPYTVTATVGLSLRDDYEVAVEPVMSSAIIDWAADLYQRRNVAASYESTGGGVAVNYVETVNKALPSRIRVTLDPWRRVLV
jgi:hypothetical protein